MRTILILIFSLMAVPALAANLQGIVFGYECKHIDPKETGFSCQVETSSMTVMKIHFYKDIKRLPESKKEYISYRYHSLLLRYFDLGGNFFEVTYKHDPKVRKECSKSKRKRFSFNCNQIDI